MSVSSRPFGVELEFYNAPHPEVVAWRLSKLGLKAYDEDVAYEKRLKAFSYWRVGGDSSISGTAFRLELASPILRGKEGIEQVRQVCRALNSLGCLTNKSCGLHVHTSNHKLTSYQLLSMFRRYARWESEIDSYMHPNRRENKNKCAKSLARTAKEIEALYVDAYERRLMLRTVRDFVESVDSSHQHKLDFDSHLRHKTTEWRHHHGSINGVEVSNWIKFCLNFVEVSASLAEDPHRPRRIRKDTGPLMGLKFRAKQHFMFQAEKFA